MPADPVPFGRATVSDCEREQIHIPGSVQPHGCLLALTPDDLRVVHAGGDTQTLLGAPPEALLSQTMGQRFGPAMIAALQTAAGDGPHIRRLVSFDAGAGDIVEGAVHRSDGLLVLELEPPALFADEPADLLGLVQDLVQRIQNTESAQLLCQAVTEGVRRVCGFDRVMVYRFLQDGSGSVIAETHADGMEPYLGLRYPASDIPAQARALYVRNRIRLIADARYKPAPLLAAPDAPAAPLDLSLSILRSVSPIHLEYLANMGVVGSMSLSIVIDGQLWGLIACHHRTPRFVSPKMRTALELFSQITSFQLETKSAAEDYAVRLRSKVIQESLVKELTHERDLAGGLDRTKQSLLEYIPASGLALWIDGSFSTIGVTPPEDDVRDLVAWLNASVREGVFYTERLVDHYPRAETFASVASGILALSVSRVPRDYLIWFRPELVQVVRWAGDPSKAIQPNSDRLSPRTSFADWQELVRLQSEPWSSLDIKTSQSLRVSLLEIVLEHVDQLARERERARVQQEALLAELDRRITQWEQTAEQLKREGDRRAVLETELSEVLRRTVVEQESERQRIARELHDSLGQYLTIMQLDLDGIGRDVSASASVKDRVNRLKELTADVGQEVGHLAWEIRPTALDDLGLQTAIQQFLEEWGERAPLLFDLHLALHDRRLSPAIETALYRVLQEAIINVVKHAGATRVGVILDANESEARLIVEDDGKGFAWDEPDPSASPPLRLGLLGVRERLALLGGTLEIETSPGAGTTLLIHVPL
ncbi:MAG: GAF domain-containing protein [Hyphomonadaceae bacterium]